MNYFPFVSRARFLDREREILEFRRELADLKFNHERVLDEINFRSTGFHLYQRFDRKEEPVPVAVGPVPETPATGVSDAINKVGRRPSAIRQYMETTATQGFETQEREAMERMPSDDVLRQINQAMALADQRAKA